MPQLSKFFMRIFKKPQDLCAVLAEAQEAEKRGFPPCKR